MRRSRRRFASVREMSASASTNTAAINSLSDLLFEPRHPRVGRVRRVEAEQPRGDDFLSTTSSQPSDSEGGFQIEGVVPGEYTINVNMPNRNMYLKRILFGSEEVTPGDSVLVPAGFSGQLNVLVSPKGGRIEGVASNRDGEAMPNAMVTLLPLDMPEPAPNGFPSTPLQQAVTGRNGDFSLVGIAPGEYRLVAWEANQSVPFLDPEFMRRFTARGERVSIQVGDGLSRNLEVIPESEIQ